MHILVVNYYKKNKAGETKFQAFLKLVREGEVDITTVSESELDDYLYVEGSLFRSVKSQERFEVLDCIIIEGDYTILPWSESAEKLLLLLRMCLKSQKSVFASQCALQALVFLCATDLERGISIVNGNRGSPIGDFSTLRKNLEDIEPDRDFFLDNVTGDLYSLDSESMQWCPVLNTGMHVERAAEERLRTGEFVIKTPVYRPQNLRTHDNKNACLVSLKECICKIRGYHVQHYIFKGFSSLEFMVEKENPWEVHPFTFKNVSKSFTVLAESLHGPAVLQFGSAILGTAFAIKASYHDTVRILENYAKQAAIRHLTGEVADFFAVPQQNTQNTQITQNSPRLGRTKSSNSNGVNHAGGRSTQKRRSISQFAPMIGVQKEYSQEAVRQSGSNAISTSFYQMTTGVVPGSSNIIGKSAEKSKANQLRHDRSLQDTDLATMPGLYNGSENVNTSAINQSTIELELMHDWKQGVAQSFKENMSAILSNENAESVHLNNKRENNSIEMASQDINLGNKHEESQNGSLYHLLNAESQYVGTTGAAVNKLAKVPTLPGMNKRQIRSFLHPDLESSFMEEETLFVPGHLNSQRGQKRDLEKTVRKGVTSSMYEGEENKVETAFDAFVEARNGSSITFYPNMPHSNSVEEKQPNIRQKIADSARKSNSHLQMESNTPSILNAPTSHNRSSLQVFNMRNSNQSVMVNSIGPDKMKRITVKNNSKEILAEGEGSYISLNKDLYKFRDEKKEKWVGNDWLYY